MDLNAVLSEQKSKLRTVMREEFGQVLSLTKNGKCGKIQFNIDGEVYTRIFRPRERLIILGGGHIAKCLCTMADMVGFDIVVVDDRQEYANADRFPEAGQVLCGDFEETIRSLSITASDYIVIVTRAHKCDAVCIRAVLECVTPYYIGLLGSKSRTRGLIARLKEEGVAADRLDAINTPVGLDIGALTVEEITVSIVAELIKFRRKDLKKRSDNHILIEENYHEEVVEGIISGGQQALILVYDTIGSSPVKSGAFMSIDAGGTAIGTIGGGLAENIAIKKASELIGTGDSLTITLNLTEDEASEEGMVCGGTMKILMMDI